MLRFPCTIYSHLHEVFALIGFFSNLDAHLRLMLRYSGYLRYDCQTVFHDNTIFVSCRAKCRPPVFLLIYSNHFRPPVSFIAVTSVDRVTSCDRHGPDHAYGNSESYSELVLTVRKTLWLRSTYRRVPIEIYISAIVLPAQSQMAARLSGQDFRGRSRRVIADSAGG